MTLIIIAERGKQSDYLKSWAISKECTSFFIDQF